MGDCDSFSDQGLWWIVESIWYVGVNFGEFRYVGFRLKYKSLSGNCLEGIFSYSECLRFVKFCRDKPSLVVLCLVELS